MDSLPASGLTPRLYDWTVSSVHLGFCFYSFFITVFCLLVPCGRLSWLFVSFWAHVSIVHRIVLYRIDVLMR